MTDCSQPVCNAGIKPAAPQETDLVSVLVSIYRANSMAFGIPTTPEMEAAFQDRVMNELGGEQRYVPRISSARRKQMHDWIRANWRGDNADELARHAGLSPRRVRQLVNA
jgi:Mor family transcriptional regulator